MTESKNFFRRALDAIVAGRTREAHRQLELYRRTHPDMPKFKD